MMNGKTAATKLITRPGIWLMCLSLFLLAGCGGGELTYRVLGNGTADVTWIDGDGAETSESVTLPWENTLSAPSGGSYRLEALRTDDGQGISCQVLFDGEQIGESGDALVFAGCSGDYDISGGDRTVTNQSSRDVLPSGKSALPQVGLDALTDVDSAWEDRFDRLKFETYKHDLDCLTTDNNLIIERFEIDLLAETEIEDCSNGGITNYANVSADFEGYGSMFMVIGYNNHPRDRDEYASFLDTDLPVLHDNFTSLFDEYESRNGTEITADLAIADYNILSNTQDGFMRIATIPNFDTSAGLNIVFIAPSFSLETEDEFKLFDAYTKEMIRSVRFLDEPVPEADPTAEFLEGLGNWEDRYNRIQFAPFVQTIDCTPYNSQLLLQEIAMDIPEGMNTLTCEENPEAYVVFTADMSAFNVPEMQYIVGRVDHPQTVEEYVEFARGAVPGFAQTDIITPYNGALRDDSNLEIGEFLYIRYDYDIVRDGNPGFARLVLYPNLETGNGVFFIMLSPTITGDLEDEYLLFDATTKRVIESTRFSLDPEAGSASSAGSDGSILSSIDPGMDVGHLIAFDDVVGAGSIDAFMFLGTEGDRVTINASADASLALALRNLNTEEVVATHAGTDAVIEYTLPVNGLFQIGVINSAETDQSYVATFEGDIGISFELRPNFYAIGSYAPDQRLSYLVLEAEAGDELAFQALPHPDLYLDLGVELFAFSDSTQLLSQDNNGPSVAEDVYYTVGQDGLNPPYVLWVEGVDGEGGIFMVTINQNGVGNLIVP